MAPPKLYIHLYSLHGLIRGENLEMGRDADTGGQISYVVELARHLSVRDDVEGVDLFTRLVADRSVSSDYADPVEILNNKCRIVRIQCGGRRYIRKELLWPYLDEYIDKTIRFIKKENRIPDIVHGHYPDAGYVAMHLANSFGLPFVYTGHSLGRSKQIRLASGGMRASEMEKFYKINRRINTEEDILANADLVIVSTNNEIEQQYSLYHHKDVPEYKVIPPGIDIDKFYPFYHDLLDDHEKSEEVLYAQASILKEMHRFFMQPDKPMILSLCRADKRKNISGLVRAYGQDQELQTMANLAIFAGLRKDIDAMADNERDVLTEMLLLMDKYDLYGKMAIPKKHDFEFEVPALYRLAAQTRGVFINPALTEPFGLTLLEASATGLPIVATNDGGPVDIVRNCRNGLLVDATQPKAIAGAIRKIIAQNQLWDDFSKKGIMNVREHYTWDSHARNYCAALQSLSDSADGAAQSQREPRVAIGRRLMKMRYFIITDIDNTLIGEDNSRLDELLALLAQYRDYVGFGIATGRTVESAVKILAKHKVPAPDIMICSVGSEIYYGSKQQFGQGWASHIANRWDRGKIVDLLKEFEFLTCQESQVQRDYKISYYMSPAKDRLAAIHDKLRRHKCRYNMIYSHDRFLDILPYRASKGKAIRYLSYKWGIPLKNILVSGDSGNDEEMLRGEPKAVVVGNYSHELDAFRGNRRIYFADASCAGGIIEGIAHYNFLDH